MTVLTRPFLFSLLSLLFLVKSRAGLVPAMYVFGDSLVDCGNNNHLKTQAKANFLPYGIDFPGGTTGRFTNGFTVPDFLAQWMGLPLAPPFLGCDIESCGKNLSGYNFGSGSAGILPETGSTAYAGRELEHGKTGKIVCQCRCYALAAEIQNPTPDDLSRHLSMSIFYFCIGSNDYALNFRNLSQSNQYCRPTNPQEFAKLLADAFGKKLEAIYQLGGRKFLVFGLPPLGCSPDLAGKGGQTQCAEEVNNSVNMYNANLELKIKQLTSILPNSSFVLINPFNLTYDIMANPLRYGFKDTTDSCVKDKIPCENRDEYFSWDGVHPTQAVNRIIASEIFNGKGSTTSMNVADLIKANTS